ncbi:hypothetical protein BJ944DRAFT_269143 [Cunninghamella echinulata]|nr:hypothetical protein BJ944DRAFT_269143 [Cunninghamella echinulata]
MKNIALLIFTTLMLYINITNAQMCTRECGSRPHRCQPGWRPEYSGSCWFCCKKELDC